MMTSTQDHAGADDALSVAFRQFHEAIAQALPSAQHPGYAPAVGEAANAAATTMQAQLLQQLELCCLDLRASRRGAAQIESTRYLMAALADELLLNHDWPGREAWPQHLLETALFASSIAGDRVFQEIERVLSDREPADRGLARLQLAALSLGFRGRWQGLDDQGQLAALRRELFQFAEQRPPAIASRGAQLAAQPYASTQSHATPRRAPTVGRWAIGFALALGGVLVASQIAWLWPTWPLRTALDSLTAKTAIEPALGR